MKFSINKNVLIPRPETEYLIHKTIEYIDKYLEKPTILDLGTGSGLIAITLKHEIQNAKVTAVDISSKALKIAKQNAKQNKTDIKFIKSNMLNKVKGKYDVIISNPPYINKTDTIDKIVYENEPHLALFADNNGLFYYEEILKNASKYLNKENIIAFEIGDGQQEEIIAMANKYFPTSKVKVETDLAGKNRFIFILNNVAERL